MSVSPTTKEFNDNIRFRRIIVFYILKKIYKLLGTDFKIVNFFSSPYGFAIYNVCMVKFKCSIGITKLFTGHLKSV